MPLLLDENSSTRGNQLKLRGGNFRTDRKIILFLRTGSELVEPFA